MGDDFRPRGFYDVERNYPPLSYAYFDNSIYCSFLFTVVNLYRNKIWFIKASKTCAFILRVSIYKDTGYFFGSMYPGREDATVVFVRFTRFFQGFGPDVDLIRFLSTRFFQRSEVRIFQYRQFFNDQVGKERKLICRIYLSVMPVA